MAPFYSLLGALSKFEFLNVFAAFPLSGENVPTLNFQECIPYIESFLVNTMKPFFYESLWQKLEFSKKN